MEPYTPGPKLVYNAIRTPDGTVLESRSRHEYVTYKDQNGLTYMVDGGLEYLRRNHHPEHPETELSLRESDPFEEIRTAFKWGTYGPKGDEPKRLVALCDLEDDHILRILALISLNDLAHRLMKREQQYRIDNRGELYDMS